MEENIFISIVIPVYNEQDRIHSFLTSVIEYLSKKDFSHEIIIVDDGSNDKTVPIVKNLLDERLPDKYRIIQLAENTGKDADGSTAVEEIDRFIPCFTNDTDIYIARRTLKQEAPFKRKFFGYGYIILANHFLKLGVSDITCGFKCYTKQSAQKIFSRQMLHNWSFDAEDIFIARKYNLKIREIPVTWKHTPGSKVRVLKNIIVCALDLLRIRFGDIRGRYSQ